MDCPVQEAGRGTEGGGHDEVRPLISGGGKSLDYRDIERRKGPETLPGPSFDLGIPNIYGRDYQHRPINDPMDPSAGDDPYNVPREEPSSAGRKFFFADPHQRPNVEDRYGEIRRKDSFGEPGTLPSQTCIRNKIQQSIENLPKISIRMRASPSPPQRGRGNPLVPRYIKEFPVYFYTPLQPPINPNDFVEEFSDDDWNEV